MRTLLVPLTLIVLLSACGYKGPLYLPDSKASAQQHKQDASQPQSTTAQH